MVEAGYSKAQQVVSVLRARGQTVAVAESLTGGWVCSAIVDVPGASQVFSGGVVAYTAELKSVLLGVSAELIAQVGTVHARIARAMALGIRQRTGATWAVATTGVAGPSAVDDHPPGTAFVAVVGPPDPPDNRHLELGNAPEDSRVVVSHLVVPGDRMEVRRATVAAALDLLAQELD